MWSVEEGRRADVGRLSPGDAIVTGEARVTVDTKSNSDLERLFQTCKIQSNHPVFGGGGGGDGGRVAKVFFVSKRIRVG